MNTFSLSLSLRVFDLLEAGKSNDEIIAIVGCSWSTFYSIQRANKNGKGAVSPRANNLRGRPRTAVTEESCQRLRDEIRSQPRRSLRDHGRRLDLSEPAVHHAA